MAQIMVIEPDELVVTSLEKIFRGDEDVKLNFVENFELAIEILNGNPAFKNTYGKLKAIYDAANTELLEATQKEVAAKNSCNSTAEILTKYQSDLENLITTEAEEKKASPPDVESATQRTSLAKEIERLSTEMKTHHEVLSLASKLKVEKEKIAQEKLTAAEIAKTDIPAPNDELYSVLMISNKFLLPNVTQWIEHFEKQITFQSNKDIKIVALGFEFDEKTVRKHLNPRISDYMVKPIDELLARQNIKFLALTDKKPKREVYSLQIKEPVDLVFEFELESLSEYSFIINSREKFETGEFRAFNCDLFLRKGQKSVLAKCLSSVEKSGGGFLSEFWFVGMDTHLAFQIKTVLKNASKSA